MSETIVVAVSIFKLFQMFQSESYSATHLRYKYHERYATDIKSVAVFDILF